VTPLVRFGRALGAELRLTARGANGAKWWFEINGRDRFRLGLPGAHNALNAMATVAVARHLGVRDAQIDEALACSEPVAMRMSRCEVGEVVVYNDAYNANPDSVVAALETFAETSAGSARRVLVLGDMLELGESAVELHGEVALAVVDLDRRLPIDHVVLIGPLWEAAASPIRRAFSANRVTALAELNDQTADEVAGLLQPGDAALLKASRALGLERIIDAVETRQGARTPAVVAM
jgi:UDP-N-acetylmuramoyl-tripeptide--D-alanyl-D-alanine ligase